MKPGTVLFTSKNKLWRVLVAYTSRKCLVWQNFTDCEDKGKPKWMNCSIIPLDLWEEFTDSNRKVELKK